ncbi:hypothetical protein [Cytobacillus gottheilii]|uniref:hypothetical protein n=1 Tax=Cytobacillus gottheilii TaxID=859144 RepID=UPI0024948A45|nr:hypothetical protein [Cytobacillus gottheilii]
MKKRRKKYKRKFCTPINGNTPCTSSLVFDINTMATGTIRDIPETGIVKLKGTICPTCTESFSDFSLTFIDQNILNGNQSFEFIPTTIAQSAFEDNYYVPGVLVFPDGSRAATLAFILLFESSGTGQPDFLQLVFYEFRQQVVFPCFEVANVILQAQIPDNQLFSRECL